MHAKRQGHENGMSEGAISRRDTVQSSFRKDRPRSAARLRFALLLPTETESVSIFAWLRRKESRNNKKKHRLRLMLKTKNREIAKKTSYITITVHQITISIKPLDLEG